MGFVLCKAISLAPGGLYESPYENIYRQFKSFLSIFSIGANITYTRMHVQTHIYACTNTQCLSKNFSLHSCITSLVSVHSHVTSHMGHFTHTSLHSQVTSLMRHFTQVSLHSCITSLACHFTHESLHSRVTTLKCHFTHASLYSCITSILQRCPTLYNIRQQHINMVEQQAKQEMKKRFGSPKPSAGQ